MMLPAAAAEPTQIRILVVEDEVFIRLLVAEELREAGFAVIEAATADEALAWLRAGGAADLVFSDVRMPGSMSGVELARTLRAQYPLLPVVLTSGNGSPHPVEGTSFIPKPYNVAEAVSLLRQIARALPGEARDE